MRPDDLFTKPSSAVLDAPEEIYAPAPTAASTRRRSRRPDAAPGITPGRDVGDDVAGRLPASYSGPHPDDGGFDSRRSSGGVRFRFNGRALRLPKTLWGRIFTGIALVIFAAGGVAALIAVRSFFLHDPRFTIASSSSIQTVGNTHLSRAQLLSVFGEDVERNIFNIPLAARRAELESLPWVEHATVMRLLPNHLRIAITERTPVAFVRQGSQIGMVDAHGVLLDIPPDAAGDLHYSFPVITGIGANDPLSTRAARMKIYTGFTADLDSSGDRISSKLSEVDLSNPEDVKVLIPEGNADILVHFGESDFLSRYQKFEQHLQEWRTQYPKLASVDMRYERQVVLEMQPGAATSSASGVTTAPSLPPVKPASSATKPIAKPASSPTKAIAMKPAAKPVAKSAVAPAAAPAAKPVAKALAKPTDSPVKPKPTPTSAPAPAASEEWHMVVVKPHTKTAAKATVNSAKPKPAHPPQAAPQ